MINVEKGGDTVINASTNQRDFGNSERCTAIGEKKRFWLDITTSFTSSFSYSFWNGP